MGTRGRQWRVVYKRENAAPVYRTFENETTARRWVRFLLTPIDRRTDETGVPMDGWAEKCSDLEWVRLDSRPVGKWQNEN